MKLLLCSHTSIIQLYDNLFTIVYSEFELEASLARKIEKTVVVSSFHGECDEPIFKKSVFFSLFPT